jgi:hypothetical protein
MLNTLAGNMSLSGDYFALHGGTNIYRTKNADTDNVFAIMVCEHEQGAINMASRMTHPLRVSLRRKSTHISVTGGFSRKRLRDRRCIKHAGRPIRLKPSNRFKDRRKTAPVFPM